MTLRFFLLLKQLTQSPTAIIKQSNLSRKIAVLVNLVNHPNGFSFYALWLTHNPESFLPEQTARE
jgi:hypothetical protein